MVLVLGIDAGGTSTRAVLATVDGERVGTGGAGGGNPIAHGAPAAAAQIRTAVRQALGDADPATVAGGVLGLAGRGALADPANAALFARMWADLGLGRAPRPEADPLVAYCSATPAPAGSVLLSGTGAAALRIEGLRVTRVADGHGWLLGDEGSAFWLGRAAAKVAVRQILAGEAGPLARLVIDRLAGPGAPATQDTADAISTAVQGAPVRTLAPLAPLVSVAAGAGDPVAASIVDEAADRLVATAAKVRDPDDRGPIVLAGEC
ncbi:N-acetylglucosamine kinase [Phytohabitans rumicis]|uniref:N-acetylglucosamine kinase n=1 Tax=Phytohabitans rumicis TaxID=1076125 RepID=A0A6V8LGN4_9ACTN|nr:BadF/BadG/BcrA/BcrD ATPase family protein [Phytohabitans rumicis]GFJ94021.1 N-acetylglucosamine kinase [Phytohabitans rumicis]